MAKVKGITGCTILVPPGDGWGAKRVQMLAELLAQQNRLTIGGTVRERQPDDDSVAMATFSAFDAKEGHRA